MTEIKPYLSVVIPAYNEADHIGECLNALRDQNCAQEKYEVIVVDNKSTDGTLEIVQQYNVELLARQAGNVGKIRNLGAQKAKGAVLAFIDADCIVDSDWITRAIKLSTDNPTTVFGGGCLLPPNPTAVEKYWLLGNSETRLPKDLIGASIVLRKESFKKIDGFDESVTSGEDTALSRSATTTGLVVRITGELSVVHNGNAKTYSEFAKRQAWHGENYIRDVASSMKDPTFIIILFSLASLSLALLTAIFSLIEWRFLFIVLFFSAPIVFSVKRIVRGRVTPPLTALPIIYALDFVYVQARSYSLLKSIFSTFRP
ncbi:glycosyltransferase [Tamilnaduibacter salinus]|uniref:glycosyltransferase n=1 Tax=Tamilnaduibacter salinus TaxID=1484056 RepID=UPI001402D006|nr:glycosyltransferase [Tamilnaduibacter salinus]